MSQGIERFPASVMKQREPQTPFERNAMFTTAHVMKYGLWLMQHLGLETEKPFMADEAALTARQKQLEDAKAEIHEQRRGVYEIGTLLAATVAQTEAEFSHQTLLDIGCGDGNFGSELARNAKSKVTFLDNNPAALARIRPKSGTKVLGDGADLVEFEDESFTKTISAFSAIPWAKTPYEAIEALGEQLRVTETDGSAFFVPILSNIIQRQTLVGAEADIIRSIRGTPLGLDRNALQVWSLQDFLLINNLNELENDGYCDVTWVGYVFEGKTYGDPIESFSAIVDKQRPIPGKKGNGDSELWKS